MTLSIDRFHHFARLVGSLLTLMGVSLIGVFAAYVLTGWNALAPDLDFGAAGMVILATVGAFQLPLGLSLMGRDGRTSFRLRIAAGAFAAMALVRLAAFAQPEMRAVLGVAPLVEFVIFGVLASLALVVRPDNEAPIEIVREYDIAAPAEEVWDVVAVRFGDVASFASGVRSALLDGPVDVGVVRTCETEPFGPFQSSTITEELVEFDPRHMRFAYVAGGELPSFIPASTNRWSITPVGPDRSRIRSHASVQLAPWAVPFAPLLGWSIGGAVDQFAADLRARLR